MKNIASQYFTKNERRSLLLLAGLVLGSVMLIYLIYYYDKPELYKMDDLLPKEILDTIAANEFIETNHHYVKFVPKKIDQKKLRKFDPNTVSIDSLREMGIDKFASSNLEKYRKKGKIKSKTQFFKIFGMKKYEHFLDSLIQLNSTGSTQKNFKPFNDLKANEYKTPRQSYTSKDSTAKLKLPVKSYSSNIPIVKIKVVELNAADSFELESIKGIGAYLSARIVKYRNRLGGFYAVEQLEEVYGLRPESYMNINHLVKADADLIKKIKINNVDEISLAAHPYIGRKTAAILMRYKKQHGDFKSLDDLTKVKIFDEEDIEKLKWYISFEE